MAPRPYWKGYLKLSLVTCPVQMEPARTSGSLTFHTLNRKTGKRVESRYVDADTGKPVDDEDQVQFPPDAATTTFFRSRQVIWRGQRLYGPTTVLGLGNLA